jgi:signal transduction histidine kinase
MRSSIGAPITVGGRLWGLMAVGTKSARRLPPDTEARLADFTELVATAIANADARDELNASRMRIVAAADQTRRRIERDLHDGIQQRLVTLTIGLSCAIDSLPADTPGVAAQLKQADRGLRELLDEVREISRGLHPAILAKAGLGPALKSLARRSAVPVEVEVHVDGRLPPSIEAAAYYFVSEALANTAKHAAASVAKVAVDQDQGRLRIRIADDGVGGADPKRGTGLLGLTDRVEALGGRMAISSTSAGTTLVAELPT